MTKERRLGRGLEALLGRVPAKGESTPRPALADGEGAHGRMTSPSYVAVAADEEEAGAGDEPSEASLRSPSRRPWTAPVEEAGPGNPVRLPLRDIESNPFQPRQEFDEADLQALCDSLRAHGLLQPIVVRRVADRFQLVAGERRLRAAAKAGWTDVPVQVIEADDLLATELAIVENLQRKDLNPIEKALSFQRYLDQHHCPQEELASRLKIDRSTIANLMRLLELPDAVTEAVRAERITAGHARALLPLGDDRLQIAFAQQIADEGWSVRETERQVQERIASEDHEPLRVVGTAGPATKPTTRNDQVAALEQELRAALGTRVEIRRNARGRGKLIVHFTSREEFDRLRSLLTDTRPASHAG